MVSASVMPVTRGPLSFRLAKLLIQRNVRGGFRLLDIAKRRGWLDRVVRYPLSDTIVIDMPLFREDNCLDAAEIAPESIRWNACGCCKACGRSSSAWPSVPRFVFPRTEASSSRSACGGHAT
jgi:hypothetical protein